MTDHAAQQGEPTITATYLNYGYAVVEVEPFETVAYSGKPMVGLRYDGAVGDQGRYLDGRGVVIKRDGTNGSRRLRTGHVPGNVRVALLALIAKANK